MSEVNYNIGVDFDNTIISYADIMYNTAVKWGLIEPGLEKDKKEIRDKIRELSDGEIAWQRIQAYVYGKAMNEAVLIEGVKEFFQACRNAGIPVSIISHKTEYASMDEDGINLRDAAFLWMENNDFFRNNGLGLSQDRVYFESTRREKIARIKQLGCTHFIDDLEETFFEESFPDNVEKILFVSAEGNSIKGAKIFSRWGRIHDYLFNQVGAGK